MSPLKKALFPSIWICFFSFAQSVLSEVFIYSFRFFHLSQPINCFSFFLNKGCWYFLFNVPEGNLYVSCVFAFITSHFSNQSSSIFSNGATSSSSISSISFIFSSYSAIVFLRLFILIFASFLFFAI